MTPCRNATRNAGYEQGNEHLHDVGYQEPVALNHRMQVQPAAWPVLLALAVLLLATAPAAADPGPEGLTLRSYLVYDVTAERVIAEYNPDQVQPVASLTKLMTAVLACERLRFDGRYILTAAEQETFHVETMRAQKMLEMMLVPSNNAVCRVVARIVAGSEGAFADLMTARARELGMASTRYANASGLPGGEQHSTMDDLLIITRYALTFPRIRSAIHLDHVELDGECYDGTLKQLYDRHKGLLGGKTGYTRAAGRCLVLLYTSHGRDYIVITLGSDGVNDGFRDVEKVLKYYQLYDGEVGQWE